MARQEQLKMTTAERRQRRFSDNFKIKKYEKLRLAKAKYPKFALNIRLLLKMSIFG